MGFCHEIRTGKYWVAVGNWGSAVIDFYSTTTSSTLPGKDTRWELQASFTSRQLDTTSVDTTFRTYQNINVTFVEDKLMCIGMQQSHFSNNFDVFHVQPKKQKICKILSTRLSVFGGGLFSWLTPSFQWGSGIHIAAKELQVWSLSRNPTGQYISCVQWNTGKERKQLKTL